MNPPQSLIRRALLVSSFWVLAGCPLPEENCQNGTDDNQNGASDCDDPACAGEANCIPPENCVNQQDDDGDGFIDCADEECATSNLCPGCGNNRPDPGEQCDDGNQIPNDGCENDCTVTQVPSCGNSVLDPGEQCDDGNNQNGDGCQANCTLPPPPSCGDGNLNAGEQCDDGNNVGGDGCRANCTIEACGDQILDLGEDCDDGNVANGDGCRFNCTTEECGDGIPDPGEQCDDGNTTNGDGCENNCTPTPVATCGNGQLNVGEGCDDGNNVGGDGCRPNCTVEICGDGIVDSLAGEECDDGNFIPGDTCDPICQNPPKEDALLAEDVNPSLLFDLAAYCDQMTTRHAVVHEVDKGDNNLRWRCGDVTSISPTQYGQEYCEYAAISTTGAKINSGNQIGAGGFSCLFTAVFNDEPTLDTQLIQALALPQNLGATVSSNVVRMQRSVNSRGAAIGLINDCSTMGGNTNEVRQTACYQAFKAAEDAGDNNLAAQLENICRGNDLTSNTAFQPSVDLGVVIPVEGDPGFEKHREIRACVSTPRGGGVYFRNSDSNICGRTFRADNECGCDFNSVPGSVDGFSFAVWFTPENNTIPSECRLAKVGGQDFPHLMICDVPTQEISEIQSSAKYQNDLTGFCNDRFGKNLGMLAPLSALPVPGSCATTTNFCQSFFQ